MSFAMFILHVFSFLLIFVHISDQSNPPTLFYFDVVDCGGERLVEFDVSLTPYPALIANEISLWLAGEFRPTSLRAKLFAQRIHVDDFVKHARVTFYTSDPFFKPYLKDYNSTYVANSNDAQDNLVAAEFLQALHKIMLLYTKSIHFIPYDMNESNHEILQIISDILTALPPPPQYIDIGINLLYKKIPVMCCHWKLQTAKQQRIESGTDFDKRKENFYNTFTTPKLENNTVCPPNSVLSKQRNQSSICKCQDDHRAGPFCAFQCNRDEMIKENKACNPILPGTSNKGSCDFTSLDYSLMCLRNYKIPLLKGNISASSNDDFNLVNVRWQLTNYFAMGPHVLQVRIRNVNDSVEVHQFRTREFYLEGYANALNVSHTCDSEVANEEMEKCAKVLKLQSFTQYALTLSVRYTAVIKSPVEYNTVGTTVFSTAEEVPDAPSLAAKLSNGTNLSVDWRLNGHCPGFIIGYSTHVWCTAKADQQEEHTVDEEEGSDVTNISIQAVDCRNKSVFPYRTEVQLPESCAGQTAHIQMRIATRKGCGEWSKIYSLSVPKALSAWIIALIVLAAIVGTALVFAVPLSYFYKKNRGFFKTWWKFQKKPKFPPPPVRARPGGISSNEYASPHTNESPPSYPYAAASFVGLQPHRPDDGERPSSAQSSYYATIVYPSNIASTTNSGYVTPTFE